MEEHIFTCGIISLSDRSFRGERQDGTGPNAIDIMTKFGYNVEEFILIPDEYDMIVSTLNYMCDVKKLNLIITCGGTGFSKRDVTPEATIAVCERLAPGIVESIRTYSLQFTQNAILSRAVCGIKGDTIILNMPGNPKACEQIMSHIDKGLKHGIETLLGIANE
ncbi:MAG: MogA/MoaB family molybdenum cofactor biosynthesis protein [Defluviitaleaceae bacterium]|nr:MogA/MoaB family molybdenum cofactor biosynthesis protein [Defluviitaleaceae bacterium]